MYNWTGVYDGFSMEANWFRMSGGDVSDPFAALQIFSQTDAVLIFIMIALRLFYPESAQVLKAAVYFCPVSLDATTRLA